MNNLLTNIFGYNILGNQLSNQSSLNNQPSSNDYNQMNSLTNGYNYQNWQPQEPRLLGPKISDLEKFPALKAAYEEFQLVMKLTTGEK